MAIIVMGLESWVTGAEGLGAPGELPEATIEDEDTIVRIASRTTPAIMAIGFMNEIMNLRYLDFTRVKMGQSNPNEKGNMEMNS